MAAPRWGGASRVGNMGVQYKGSPDDVALNAAVSRYRADPAAVARFAQGTYLTGRIPVPVLTVKGVDDPTAFVELDASFETTLVKGGSAAHLVQTFTQHSTHSYLSYPRIGPHERPAALGQRGGETYRRRYCPAVPDMEVAFGKDCAFLPAYVPGALNTRVPDRDRP